MPQKVAKYQKSHLNINILVESCQNSPKWCKIVMQKLPKDEHKSRVGLDWFWPGPSPARSTSFLERKNILLNPLWACSKLRNALLGIYRRGVCKYFPRPLPSILVLFLVNFFLFWCERERESIDVYSNPFFDFQWNVMSNVVVSKHFSC